MADAKNQVKQMQKRLIIKGCHDGVELAAIRLAKFFWQRGGLRLGEAKRLADRFADEGRLVLDLDEPLPTWVEELDAAGLVHTWAQAE